MGKARLSLLGIWNMCFGFLGVQIGFGLQNANASRIFQALGADVDKLAVLWIAAPVTGLLVQPVIGYLSDKTWGPLGRRRPYFLAGALAASTALVIMPNAPSLWVAASMLWILDASINITMEPFRAFVGDLLPEEQRTAGFAMQSVFIGSGAVLASVLPWVLNNWLHISNTAPAGQTPVSVKLAFYIGAAGFLGTVLWTVFTTKEYPPEQLESFVRERDRGATADHGRPRSYFAWGGAWMLAGAAGTALVAVLGLEKELFILSVSSGVFGLLQMAAGALVASGRTANGFSEIMRDFRAMPKVMKQLAVVQFFSWFGLFAMWIYTTPAVTRVHFGAANAASAAYAKGADWVGVLFAVYNGVAALAAFVVPVVAARMGRRVGHGVNLALGGAGLISFVLIRDPIWLLASMVGVGIAWASILSVPYAILAGALPARKMGVYMGIFNFFIVIPQMLAATLLGLLLKTFFASQPIWALVIGGASLLLAAAAVLGVSDPADPRRRARSAPAVAGAELATH
jgi:maltose/moltooligosaccharide transporter